MVFAYAALWLLSAVLNTAFGIKDGSVLLGLAAVSLSISYSNSGTDIIWKQNSDEELVLKGYKICHKCHPHWKI